MHITFLLQLGRKCATLLCESDPRNIPSSIIAFLKAQRLESSQSKRLPWTGNNEINNLHIIKEFILSWRSGKDKTIFYLPLPKVRLWDWNYYEVVKRSSLTPSNFLSSSSQGINGQLCHILQLVVSLTKIEDSISQSMKQNLCLPDARNGHEYNIIVTTQNTNQTRETWNITKVIAIGPRYIPKYAIT